MRFFIDKTNFEGSKTVMLFINISTLLTLHQNNIYTFMYIHTYVEDLCGCLCKANKQFYVCITVYLLS